MTYLDLLRAQLRFDEGVRDRPYDDATGNRLVAPKGNVTLGVGHNSDANPLRPDEIALILENDIADAETAARSLIPNFDELSDGRKAVVVNMAFNMGRDTFAQFTGTLRAIRQGKWADAASGMMHSLWAKQVGARAVRLSTAMRLDNT